MEYDTETQMNDLNTADPFHPISPEEDQQIKYKGKSEDNREAKTKTHFKKSPNALLLQQRKIKKNT